MGRQGIINSCWILVLRSASVVLLLVGVETEVETLLVTLEAKKKTSKTTHKPRA